MSAHGPTRKHPWIIVAAVLVHFTCGWLPAAPDGSDFLMAFSNRLARLEAGIPTITRAAEAAAARTQANTNMLIDVPYGPQPSFAEEMVNRSGCLANAIPSVERPKLMTPQDVVLFSVRSWEGNGADAAAQLKEFAGRTNPVILCASAVGKPADLAVAFLLDNGAPDASRTNAPVNAVINVVNGWLWQCEYTAALTRAGKHPGILQSILDPGANEHNAAIQSADTRRRLFACATAIPPGDLARRYLDQVRRLVGEAGASTVRGQVSRAADLITEHIRGGGKVGVATSTHILMYEIFHDNRAPWKPFNVVWHAKTAFKENVGPQDLLVWFQFVGMSTPLEDYGGCIRETGVRCITSYLPDTNPANNLTNAVAHIDPSWRLPDASVEIPFPPRRMAPVSGINHGILYRMLDEAVARRLDTTPAKP